MATNSSCLIEWDGDKDEANVIRHAVSFSIVERLDWDTSLTTEDTRHDYGDRRFVTLGLIDAALHVIVWTPRGDALRIISVRAATRKERRQYEAQA